MASAEGYRPVARKPMTGVNNGFGPIREAKPCPCLRYCAGYKKR